MSPGVYVGNKKQSIRNKHQDAIFPYFTAYLPANLARVPQNKSRHSEMQQRRTGSTSRRRFSRFQASLPPCHQEMKSSDLRIAMELANERVEQTKKAYQYARIQTITKVFGISLAAV
jgi:hypothetical protein